LVKEVKALHQLLEPHRSNKAGVDMGLCVCVYIYIYIKVVFSVLYFEVFAHIFVLKRRKKRQKEKGKSFIK